MAHFLLLIPLRDARYLSRAFRHFTCLVCAVPSAQAQWGRVMSTSGIKVVNFFNNVVDRMFGPEPVPVVDKRAQNLAQKQMNIRAVGVREGFAAMRARSEAMTQRIEEFKKQRQHDEPAGPIDPVEQVETIVLSSPDTPRRSDNSTAS